MWKERGSNEEKCCFNSLHAAITYISSNSANINLKNVFSSTWAKSQIMSSLSCSILYAAVLPILIQSLGPSPSPALCVFRVIYSSSKAYYKPPSFDGSLSLEATVQFWLTSELSLFTGIFYNGTVWQERTQLYWERGREHEESSTTKCFIQRERREDKTSIFMTYLSWWDDKAE